MKTRRLGMGQSHVKKAMKHEKITRDFHLKTMLGLMLVTLLVVGCSGEGGGLVGGDGSSSEALLQGIFMDSAVEGLEYETETQFGVTDHDGTFMYMEGETVMFHVGDIVLGEAHAQSMMTPIDLVNGAMDETHPMVINMARFIQTLDEDMDPENGITITEEMRTAMIGHMIDFNMDPDLFEYDPDVQMFMHTLNGMHSSGSMRMMVSAENAKWHLHITIMGMMDFVTAGRFLDSSVEGLEYQTQMHFGVTDQNGTFIYMEGETVMFHVGDIVLGEAHAQSIMTPIDLVDGATDETHPMVINMARFLQTLDEDMDSENGITITDEVRAVMVGHMIDFDMAPDLFEYDPDVQLFLDTLNGVFSSGPMRMMVSAEDAQDHLRKTMEEMMSDDSGMMDDENMMDGNSGMTTSDTDSMAGDMNLMG